MCVAFSLMYAIMMQFVYPILSDTSSNLIYRILRCSLSAFIIWLLLFFSVFHCLLNILAEVTMFGDRLLYEDWWNAGRVLEEVERTHPLLVSAPRLCRDAGVRQGL